MRQRKRMIDYMHPMVLLNEQILHDINEKYELQRNIEQNTNKLQKLFRDTLLYKELKEEYFTVRLDYIYEDETVIEVTFKLDNMRGFDVKNLSYGTQEIEEKLK